MDSLSVIGFLIAITAIIGGQYLEGGHLMVLFNGPAAIIVLGGTIGAVLLETPMLIFKRALSLLPWVLFPPEKKSFKQIKNFVHWGILSRNEGVLALERYIKSPDTTPVAQKGLQLIIDGLSSEKIRDILEQEAEVKETGNLIAAKMYESMGGYSPTIGIIGAVLGLIHVLGNLTDPEALGPGIAVAFVATIYGVGFANILCIPIGKKIKNIIFQQTLYDEMIIDGVCALAEGEHPQAIEYKLRGYLDI
jgi:chemotaxis protein MotA